MLEWQRKIKEAEEWFGETQEYIINMMEKLNVREVEIEEKENKVMNRERGLQNWIAELNMKQKDLERREELLVYQTSLPYKPEQHRPHVTRKEFFNLCNIIIPFLISVCSLRFLNEKFSSIILKALASMFMWLLLAYAFVFKVSCDSADDLAEIMYFRAKTGGKKIFYEKFPSIVVGYIIVLNSFVTMVINYMKYRPVLVYWLAFSTSVLTTLYAVLQLFYSDKYVGCLNVENGRGIVQRLQRSKDHARRGRMMIYVKNREYQRFRI